MLLGRKWRDDNDKRKKEETSNTSFSRLVFFSDNQSSPPTRFARHARYREAVLMQPPARAEIDRNKHACVYTHAIKQRHFGAETRMQSFHRKIREKKLSRVKAKCVEKCYIKLVRLSLLTLFSYISLAFSFFAVTRQK